MIAIKNKKREARDHGGAILLYHTRSAYLESGGKKWNTVIKGGWGGVCNLKYPSYPSLVRKQ